jgi:hypothetical protein
MQMSSVQVFIFVEGKQNDPFFFAGVCSTIKRPRFSFEICTASQLTAASGGKQALLTFFTYLRRAKRLVSSLSGKKTACIFFVDKDVDDIQRIQKRSHHLVYTEYYDVQNYIFEHGDVLTGAAAAASVDPALLLTSLADSSAWCARMAQEWQDWITLCLFVLKEGIHSVANYGVPSRMQTRPCGPTDQTVHKTFLSRLQRKSRLPSATFRQRHKKLSDRIDSYYRQGQHHYIFKGKWFAAILSDEIEMLMSGRPYDNGGLERRLPSAIAATLDFLETWGKPLYGTAQGRC